MFSRCVSSKALCAMIVLGSSCGLSQATVLTFDASATDGQTFSALYQTYGDRFGDPFFDALHPQYSYGMGGGLTPNVEVEYRPGLTFNASEAPGRRYGDLHRVLSRQFGGNDQIRIDLLPATNAAFQAEDISVLLYSFDLASVLSENLPAQFVLVTDSMGNVLFRDSPVVGNPGPIIPAVDGGGNPTHRTYDFTTLLGGPIASTPGRGLQIIVGVGQIATKVDRYGIDNIKFGQLPIPTPGATALLAIGGVLAARRRRG